MTHRSPTGATATRVVRAIAMLLASLIAPLSARAQLSYEHTTFLHGTGSSPAIWRAGYPDLAGLSSPEYLRRSIVLKDTTYPDLDPNLENRWAQEVAILRTDLLAEGGRHVLVTHSVGGLVARGAYLNLPLSAGTDVRPNIAAIITIAATHQGTQLADSALHAIDFFKDVQKRVDAGLAAIQNDPTLQLTLVIGEVFSGRAVRLIQSTDRFPDVSQFTDAIKPPIIEDQKIHSGVIEALNASTAASTADQAVPRANIVGMIPVKNALVRVMTSLENHEEKFNELTGQLKDARTALTACKWLGYTVYVLVDAHKGRKCAYGAKQLARIDDKWAGFVNGRVTFNLGLGTLSVGRDIPFDGIVSNERSQYPGSTSTLLNLPPVDGANHQNIYKRRDGLDQVAAAMRFVQMEQQPAPLGALLNGPSSFTSGMTLTWTVTASGGRSPYAYQWSYKSTSASTWTTMTSTGTSASRTVTSTTPSFTVRAVVTAADGQVFTVSRNVANAVSGGGCVPQPGGSSCPQ